LDEEGTTDHLQRSGLAGGPGRRGPVALWTILDAFAGELSWSTVFLRLLIWAVVSALMALAFSGGVEPRRERDGR
jgi:hypothetical protein